MIRKIINQLRSVKHKYVKPGHRQIFSDIYKNKKWGADNESLFYSGSGSDDEHSVPYINVISEFIQANKIKTVVDLGCGDFRIGRRITETSQVSYTGVDVVKDLVKYNNRNFKRENIRFLYKNIVKDKLPDGELCLIRQVLQHLSNNDIKAIVDKCKKYKYLIITEHLPLSLTNEPNIDKQPDAGIRYYAGSGVYLDLPPYNKKVKELLSVFPEDHPNSKIVTYQIFL
jgi:SAM-dependent methyltransferase